MLNEEEISVVLMLKLEIKVYARLSTSVCFNVLVFWRTFSQIDGFTFTSKEKQDSCFWRRGALRKSGSEASFSFLFCAWIKCVASLRWVRVSSWVSSWCSVRFYWCCSVSTRSMNGSSSRCCINCWCFCWSVLWDGEPGLTEAKPSVYKAVEGGDQSVTCRSYQTLNVSKRMFCRNNCNEEDILVETSGNKQENGRYSIKHEKKGSPPVDMITVKITNVTRSDAGRYRCFYERPVNSSYSEFIIEVIEGKCLFKMNFKDKQLLEASEQNSTAH